MEKWQLKGYSSKEVYEQERPITILQHCKFMTYEELIQPVADPENWDHPKFCGALAYAFDIDRAIVGDAANRDYLCFPKIKDDFPRMNYIQCVTFPEKGLRQFYCDTPVFELLRFSFYDEDHHFNDPYEKDDWLLLKISQHISKVLSVHGSFKKYFEYVSERLWRPKSYVHDLIDFDTQERLEGIEFRWKEKETKSKLFYAKEILPKKLGEQYKDVSPLIFDKLIKIIFK